MRSTNGPGDGAHVSPITDDDLDDVARFLHENLNSKISVKHWLQGIAPAWSRDGPNHGMMLRDAGQMLGAFPAIYYKRSIAGVEVSICNPHSWFVLESHRAKSMSLVLPLVRQRGYQFVMLTPNPSVAEIFRFLKFTAVDPTLVLSPCLPSPLALFDSVTTASRSSELDSLLSRESLEVYRDHCDLPWLSHLAVGDEKGTCYLVFKRAQIKGVPVARVLHVSDPIAFHRLWRNISNALIARFGLFGIKSEARWFSDLPWPVVRRVNGQPKLLFGELIDERSIDDLYTELVALDI